MDITIYPQKLQGQLTVIPSKSQAHRLLICAAFSNDVTFLHCPETNQDIEATAQCLRALGADIVRTCDGYNVTPITVIPEHAILNCCESGSTLRFMLPIAGALGVDTLFLMSGRLPNRPLSPLWEEMERMGCTLTRPDESTIHCSGKLIPGKYSIDGSVSSQFITGLLFSMALIQGECCLNITGTVESKPYINMTRHALSAFGISTEAYCVNGCRPFTTPGYVDVEGDWSNGAFFLTANSLDNNIEIKGLQKDSPQGDRVVSEHLDAIESFITIDAADIPDLVPILAVAAGAKKGAEFINIARLRLKESDRVASVAAMLTNLGASVKVTENTMTVHPGVYHSCTIDAVSDHRIAMAAAIAATVADGPITILGAECVSKSYPIFWDEYRRLGGHYEQYLRSNN